MSNGFVLFLLVCLGLLSPVCFGAGKKKTSKQESKKAVVPKVESITEVPARHADLQNAGWVSILTKQRQPTTLPYFYKMGSEQTIAFMPHFIEKYDVSESIYQTYIALRKEPGFSCLFDYQRLVPVSQWSIPVWYLGTQAIKPESCAQFLSLTKELGASLTKLKHKINFSIFEDSKSLIIPYGPGNIYLSSQLVRNISSESMLAGLVLFAHELSGQIPRWAEFEKVVKENNHQKKLEMAHEISVSLESLRIPLGTEYKLDEQITKQLMNSQYHPGGWYSFLRLAQTLRQRNIARLQPLVGSLADLDARIDRLKRFLDRKGFRKTSYYVGDKELQQIMKKFELEIFNPEDRDL